VASLPVTLILKALDCLATRSEVTAQNIANAGTPNYRPLHVSFESALRAAAAEGRDAVAAVKPDIEADDAAASTGGLRVDLELTTAAATALRYSALVEMLSRKAQSNALAVSGSL
jgi:flagellar basal-body rod protein FlgB